MNHIPATITSRQFTFATNSILTSSNIPQNLLQRSQHPKPSSTLSTFIIVLITSVFFVIDFLHHTNPKIWTWYSFNYTNHSTNRSITRHHFPPSRPESPPAQSPTQRLVPATNPQTHTFPLLRRFSFFIAHCRNIFDITIPRRPKTRSTPSRSRATPQLPRDSVNPSTHSQIFIKQFHRFKILSYNNQLVKLKTIVSISYNVARHRTRKSLLRDSDCWIVCCSFQFQRLPVSVAITDTIELQRNSNIFLLRYKIPFQFNTRYSRRACNLRYATWPDGSWSEWIRQLLPDREMRFHCVHCTLIKLFLNQCWPGGDWRPSILLLGNMMTGKIVPAGRDDSGLPLPSNFDRCSACEGTTIKALACR